MPVEACAFCRQGPAVRKSVLGDDLICTGCETAERRAEDRVALEADARARWAAR